MKEGGHKSERERSEAGRREGGREGSETVTSSRAAAVAGVGFKRWLGDSRRDGREKRNEGRRMERKESRRFGHARGRAGLFLHLCARTSRWPPLRPSCSSRRAPPTAAAQSNDARIRLRDELRTLSAVWHLCAALLELRRLASCPIRFGASSILFGCGASALDGNLHILHLRSGVAV